MEDNKLNNYLSIELTHVNDGFYNDFGTKGWFARVKDETTLYADSIAEGFMLFETSELAFKWASKCIIE